RLDTPEHQFGLTGSGPGLLGSGGLPPPLPVDDPVLPDGADRIEPAPPDEPDRPAIGPGLDLDRLAVRPAHAEPPSCPARSGGRASRAAQPVAAAEEDGQHRVSNFDRI